MRLYIIRHAESYSNVQGRMMSTTDLPLTEKGIRQAEAAKRLLDGELGEGGFQYAFCSPLLRARQTAEIITGGRVDLQATELLREMELGELEGLTWPERMERYPHIDIERHLSDAAFPSGEDCRAMEARCARFIEEYLRPLPADARALIATHGITKRFLINRLLGKESRCVDHLNWCDNSSFSEIEYDGESHAGRVIRLNERGHLAEGLGGETFEAWGNFSDVDYITL